MTRWQQQLNRFFEIMEASKLFSELTELTQITGSSKFVSVQSNNDDAQKIAIPALRGHLGDWEADINIPALADGVGVAGDIYDVITAGTHDFGSGSITFLVGDFVTYINGTWRRYTLVTQTSDIVNNSEDGTGFFAPFVLIGTLASQRHFLLFKGTANTDPTKRTTLETNDVVYGHDSANNFLVARFLGGDVNDFTNDAVYEKFGGY